MCGKFQGPLANGESLDRYLMANWAIYPNWKTAESWPMLKLLSIVTMTVNVCPLCVFFWYKYYIWELRDQMPSAWTTMILVQSSTALGDTQDTVVISHESNIEQITLWNTISWGTRNGEIRTWDLQILTWPLFHLSYRASVELKLLNFDFRLHYLVFWPKLFSLFLYQFPLFLHQFPLLQVTYTCSLVSTLILFTSFPRPVF